MNIMFSTIDVIFLIIIAGFALFGLWFGIVHTFGALVGIVAGAWAASHYYEVVSQWILGMFGGNPNLVRIIVFIVIFIVVNRLVGFVFWIIGKMFGVITGLPFIRGIDRLIGGVLGFIEGVLVLGTILYFASRFPLGPLFQKVLINSKLAPWLLNIANIVVPLFPEVLRKLQSIIDIKVKIQ